LPFDRPPTFGQKLWWAAGERGPPVGQNLLMTGFSGLRERRAGDLTVGAGIGAAVGVVGIAFGAVLGLIRDQPIEYPIAVIGVTATYGAFLTLLHRAWVGAGIGFVFTLFITRQGTYWQGLREDFAVVFWWSVASLVLYLPEVLRVLPTALSSVAGFVCQAWSAGLAWGRRSVRALGTSPMVVLRRSLTAAREQTMVASSVVPPPMSPVLTRERDVVVLAAAALLYAVARFVTDAFYGSFGVTAEEVGVTTPSLVLGAALATVALAIIGVGLVWTVRFIVGFSAGRLFLFTLLGLAIGLESLADPQWTDAIIGALIGFVAWWLFDGQSFWTASLGSRTLAILGGLLVVAVVGMAFQITSSSIDRVRAAEAITPTVGPFVLTSLHAPTVSVWPAEGAVLPAELTDSECVSWLGSSDGVSVLYRSGRVWRVSNENIILVERDCGA
jgi:hypothetical protein